MSDNDFYITLESNADLENHPNNTQNKFKVTLQSPLDLQGTWETGLAQLIFPHSWHEQILRDSQNNHNLFAIKLHAPGDGKDDNTSPAYWRNLYIELLDYHTIKDLVMAIRNTVELSKLSQVQFIYRGKVGEAVDMDHLRINCIDGAFVAFNLDLAKLLSYDVDRIRRENWKDGVSVERLYGGIGIEWLVVKSQYQRITQAAERQYLPAPLSSHITIKLIETEKDMNLIQNMYINSDLIETQYIGNTRSNVLRIIAPVMKKGQIETFNFAPIFYLPLRVSKFNTIEINITGDTGKLVPFDGGAVVIVLHLRRKHNILV